MIAGNTKVVQVTNIAPQATKDQMQTLFGYLGKIEDIRLYPTIRDVSCPVQSRICYVKFVDASTVGVAQHMTNTVFIDRALIVIPVINGDIPDEYYALEMTRNGTIVPGFNVNEPKLPPHVSNSVQGSGEDKVIITHDPQLIDNGLPPYPPLPAKYDSIKVEETRRTVQVVNAADINTEQLIQFFTKAGEVKYVRTCENIADNSQHILIEFSEQPSVVEALKLSGEEFNGKPLEVIHATQSIVKPQAKSNEAAQKEIEEAMSRFKEAQNMINASIEPVIGMLTKDKRSSRRSRSRSRGRRRRSRSRSASRGSRSRRRRSSSRSRKSRSRDRRKRSKSKSRRRSRSKSRRSRSKSSSKRRGSKHRSKERDSRARSHDKEKDRGRERSRDKKREKDRKSKEKESKSKDKSSRESKDKKSDKESSIECSSSDRKRSKSRSRSRRRSRSRDRKAKERKRSRSKGRKRSASPRTSRKRSRSKSRERKREKKEKKDKRDRSRSRSKIPRNYDEEEKGFDSEKDKREAADSTNEKESSEKSDNMDISNSP